MLSGAGFDGVLGAEAIKAAGGLLIVQDPATSKYDSMPKHAIKTGLIDVVAAPSQMPGVIQRYIQKEK